jgi:hypothetical protein
MLASQFVAAVILSAEFDGPERTVRAFDRVLEGYYPFKLRRSFQTLFLILL